MFDPDNSIADCCVNHPNGISFNTTKESCISCVGTYIHEESCFTTMYYMQKKKIMFQKNVRIMEKNNKVCFSYHYMLSTA